MFSIFKKSESQLDASLSEALKQGATIIDVRTEAEYATGHVEGSKNIPLDTLAQSIESLKNHKQLVLCCRSGARSGQAKSFLESYGFKQVVNGGSWQNVNQHLKK